MPDRLAPVPMIFAEFAPLDRTDDFKVIGVEVGDHLQGRIQRCRKHVTILREAKRRPEDLCAGRAFDTR